MAPLARGTTPEGALNEVEASRWVRSMFGRVAHRYDLANHLLSANIDRHWRRQTVAKVRDILQRPDSRVLDLACGTGDLLIALEREAGRRLIGSDFCHPMLQGAGVKLAKERLRSVLVESDALALPFPDASLDLITIAFGFRNFANYRGGVAGVAASASTGRRFGDSGVYDAAESGVRGGLQLVFPAGFADSGRDDFGGTGGLSIFTGIGAEVSRSTGVGGVDARGRV